MGYGHDRGGVLRDVLRVLLDGVKGTKVHHAEELAEATGNDDSIRIIDGSEPGFNVTHCWVRSVGKIGVVMLRFTTIEVNFRRLSRWVREINAGERSIEGDVITVGTLQSRALGSGSLERASIRLRLHRTGRPWHLDASIRSGVVRYEGSRKAWEKPEVASNDGSITPLDSGQDRFEQLLHNLAADQELDVAQTDVVISKDAPAPVGVAEREEESNRPEKAIALIRLFDLGSRGRHFIRHSVQAARLSIAEPDEVWHEAKPDDTHPGFSYTDDGDIAPKAKENAQLYIKNALRGPVLESGSDSVAADIMVHALDVPGLLAEVYGFIKREGIQIVRVCCRGLGSDAVVLLAVKLPKSWPQGTSGNTSDAERALKLETMIRRRVDLFLHKNSEKARFAEITRGMMHPAGYWRVFVHLGASGEIAPGSSPIQAFVQSRVDEIEDRPRLLLKLVRLLNAFAGELVNNEFIQSRDQVSIFYLDVRPLRRGQQMFSEIGLGVSMPVESAEYDERVQSRFDEWFNRAFAELQSLPPAPNRQD